MANDFSALYAQFKELLDTGTEQQAEQFLIDHMEEFPEDLRQGIMLALFEKGLQEAAGVQAALNEIKSEGMEVIKELETGKRILDDKLKVLALQEKL